MTNFSTVLSAIGSFLGNFRAVFLGIVFAYVLNPVASFFYFKVLKKMKTGQTRWGLAVALAVLSGLLLLLLLLGTLIPQLVQSVATFSENIDSYAASMIKMLENSPLKSFVDAEGLATLSQNALSSITNFVRENSGRILSSAANSGKGIITAVIAAILAVYLLIDKKRVMSGFWRFLRSILPPGKTEEIMDFSLRCHMILMNYLGQTLLDTLIVGLVNALFMIICPHYRHGDRRLCALAGQSSARADVCGIQHCAPVRGRLYPEAKAVLRYPWCFRPSDSGGQHRAGKHVRCLGDDPVGSHRGDSELCLA